MTIEATLKTEDEEFVRLLRRKPGRALSGKGGGRSYGGGYSGGRRGYSGYSSYTGETLAGELHMTTAGELHTTTAGELHTTTAVELLFLIAEEEHRRARAGSIRLIRDLATTTTSLPTDLTAPPTVTVDIMCIPPAAAWGFPSPDLVDSVSAMPWEATLVTT
ncbi:Galnt10, partial [Symbiodinium necroappetens]